MSDNSKYVQSQPFTLYGSGASLGDTSVVITSLVAIDGSTLLTMTDFGTKGFMTLEPNAGTQEEQISFIDIVQNANGTATLTGVSTVLFVDPYTETSGLAKDHAGGTQAIVTNTAGFYARLCAKDNDETITGTYTFTTATRPLLTADTDTAVNAALVTFGQLARTSFSGTVNGSTVQKGIYQTATGAELAAGTSTGSTGAEIVPNGGSFTNTSVGAGDANKIPVLAADGTIAQEFLNSARTIGAVYSATANNMQITTDADTANDAVRYSFAQTIIPQGAVSGTSGEAITAGQALYVKASDGKLYKTDADADESTFSFVGVALSTVAAADLAVTYAPPGHTVTGLAGLVAGSFYYISGTAGALATTPGARFARIGIAVSTTALLVVLPKYKVSGTQSITSATTFVQTVGFYPGKISIRAAIPAGGGGACGASIGDDTNTCIGFQMVGANNKAEAEGSLAWSCYDINATTLESAGTVSAKSATGFTLSCSTYTTTVTVQWTAESL